MLILNKNEIEAIFSMREAINANKEALALYSDNKTLVPLRTHINMSKQNGQSLFMPAYVPDTGAIGIKIVSFFPDNAQVGKPALTAQMLLLDSKTGEVAAMLDGTYLTQLRTGALQGLATELLSRRDAKIAMLYGVGGQATAQLEAMLTVRDLDKIYVVSPHFEKTVAFVSSIESKFSAFKTKIIPVKTSEPYITEADIITAATSSYTPVFDGSLVKVGSHINGIGAYQPDMQELPAEIIQRADKIYFDTREGVMAEAGDILIPLKEGFISTDDFTGELGEVILERKPARESGEEITLFKSVGTAILDVVMAQKIYQKATITPC